MQSDETKKTIEATLFSSQKPTPDQLTRLKAFLYDKYLGGVSIEWKQDDKISTGVRLEVENETYDWTTEGRLRQLRERLRESIADSVITTGENTGDVVAMFRESVSSWTPSFDPSEEGEVVMVGDGIVIVDGLPGATYGEIISFDNGTKGMVSDLTPDSIGVILFADEASVSETSKARRTGKMAGMPASEDFLGRVVNALGEPIDDLGPIISEAFLPVEAVAPSIIERQSVDTPMSTGLLSIDSMFPIGRGQRELIIGDRQTGKTSIARDTILNQRDNDVICIYVAIGQKASSVAQFADSLRKAGAMDYTVIVNASASESASIQYIAPYAGTSLAEFFMRRGRDVLIIYDDLSKHAVAYRALSLLLERSPGREAYPGDVFYLHSRLLERSSRLSDENGGGSITALPIVETQAGDVSAYIPTNIISITDGQIFLESDLFYSGQRPAVNVGLSVSRVGGAAQTKAMKKATGSLKLDLSQFREMEVFTQFSSDLDEATRARLTYGQGLMRILRQEQGRPFSEHEQVMILICATAKVMTEVPISRLLDFRARLLEHLRVEIPKLCDKIDREHDYTDEDRELIINTALGFRDAYLSKKVTD